MARPERLVGSTVRWLAPAALMLLSWAGAGPQRPAPPSVYGPSPAGVIAIRAEGYQETVSHGGQAWTYVRVPNSAEGTVAMGALPERDVTYPSDRVAAAPRLGYRVAFDRPGRYYVWIRAFAENGGSDSVYLGLDEDAEHVVTVIMYAYGTSGWTDRTPELARAVIDVDHAGTRSLDLWMREDGLYLEDIVLTRDATYLPPLSPGAVLWHADHETGDLSQWRRPDFGVDLTCGGEYDNGGARTEVSTDVAHTGRYSAKLILSEVDGSQGARLMRGRCENMAHGRGLYYSAWYFFPTHFETPAGWWNVWQWKSKGAGDAQSRVTWAMDALNLGNEMVLRLRDKTEAHEGGDARYYPPAKVTVPVGRWVHIEAFYLPSDRPEGEVIVWQDGEQIYAVSNVQTVRPGGDTRWSVNNYTSDIEPDPAVIYVDDASISLERMGDRTPWAP